jgi:hypothetical protein
MNDIPTQDELIDAATLLYGWEAERLNLVPDQPDAALSTVESQDGLWTVRLCNVNGLLSAVEINRDVLACVRWWHEHHTATKE